MGPVEYKLSVCGCGPAGISALVYMEEKMILDLLVEQGICLIDRANQFGRGNIGSYKITANSLGKVFTEIFSNPDSELLAYLKEKDSYQEIVKNSKVAPCLSVVGDLMEDIGEYFYKKINNTPRSKSYINSKVIAIYKRSDGRFEIEFMSDNNEKLTVISEQIILNIGGKQEPLPFIKQKFANNTKIWTSNDFIRGNQDNNFISILCTSKRRIEVTIIGSSHSAFSVLYRLKNHFKVIPSDLVHVNVLYKNPPRLYFQSEEVARDANYQFVPATDVCPQSGRVNRFSGLRYDSFDMAREIFNQTYSNVSLYPISSIGKGGPNDILEKTDIVIPCLGYKNKPIHLYDEDGTPLDFDTDHYGIKTDINCNPFLKDGRLLKNVYIYGLGAGQRVNKLNGGEKSYTGRIDGVWFYQHVVSSRIVPLIIRG